MDVITVEHPRWPEFVDEAVKRNIAEPRACRRALEHVAEALAAMGGVDVPQSLAYFRDHAARCDCEAFENVIRPWYEWACSPAH